MHAANRLNSTQNYIKLHTLTLVSLLAGVLGDPKFFVLESRDDDRETRVFDPVLFSLPGKGLCLK
jgi:hypothetical protein